MKDGTVVGRSVRPPAPFAAAAVAASAVLLLFVRLRDDGPPRCPPGLIALGARCCGEGSRLDQGRCAGATSCSEGLSLVDGHCVARFRVVTIPSGSSAWKPPDDTVGPGEYAVTGTFRIDAFEVTHAAWTRCVKAGVCAELEKEPDPGRAASGMTLSEARRYCRFAGGRLPRDAEWLRTALGDVETRYPWGDPDALCLRAAFGLVSGRCAKGAAGPDTAGARPGGKTKLGVHDLAGNVAEWVDDGAPAGKGAVRGGSFEDDDATALRARWRKVLPEETRLPWVGLRCAYDGG